MFFHTENLDNIKVFDIVSNDFRYAKALNSFGIDFYNHYDLTIDQVCKEKGLSTDSIYGYRVCLLYTSPSPRDRSLSRMPSSA